MKEVIYFTYGEGATPFQFVTAYRKKSLFKREKLQLSYFLHELDIDNDQAGNIIAFIKKHYPNAQVGYDTVENFRNTMYKYRYYVVAKYVEQGGFYTFDEGRMSHGERVWTTDIHEAQLSLTAESADGQANLLASRTGERIILSDVYINHVNKMADAEFVITCTSKKSQQTKFYSSSEGTRLRLVHTSDAAAKFGFTLACNAYEELKAKNKAFLYAVIPYIPGINRSELPRLAEEGKIPFAIAVTTKLKWMSRERKEED